MSAGQTPPPALDDLKRMTESQLQALAAQLRERIISTCARHGGHLGANLGVVELTLALHRVFNSPADRLIWDVGHQCYAHKLLTGRWEAFGTLRQPEGLSGFPKRSESPHDVYEGGHASTGISAALGYAQARDLAGESHEVVVVVGDGALTGGLAYEGLNNAGALGTHVIVVLNDNDMSIAPNVGAVHRYLERLRGQPLYRSLKEDVHWLLSRVPLVGERMARTAERVKDSLKYLVVPGVLFEELGFTYLGPCNGHHLPSLEEALRRAKQIPGPVLVHVRTVKGRGFAQAETAPDAGHSYGPVDPETGQPLRRHGPASYTEVFGQALLKHAENDPRLVAITAAMPEGTGLQAFARRHPRRFFDVGIAEQHALVFASGLALGGRRPVVAIYSTFLQRAYDPLIHDVGRMNVPLVLAIDRAGLVGADGESHQGAWDLAYLRTIPNFTVMVPRDEAMLVHMLATALAHESGPVAVRYPRGAGVGVPVPDAPRQLALGRGEVLREGSDVVLVGVGPLVHEALQAAEHLRQVGIAAAVADARFVKPLDEDLILRLARASGRLVCFEEGVVAGGFGSAVLELLHREGVACRVRLLGLPDQYIPQGDPKQQRKQFGLDATGIATAARALCRDRPGLEGVGL